VAWYWNLFRTPCEGDLPMYAIVTPLGTYL
jgi:hypothetical protein